MSTSNIIERRGLEVSCKLGLVGLETTACLWMAWGHVAGAVAEILNPKANIKLYRALNSESIRRSRRNRKKQTLSPRSILKTLTPKSTRHEPLLPMASGVGAPLSPVGDTSEMFNIHPWLYPETPKPLN